MKFELNNPDESSRFILALMLSSATALLVAAPLLVAMMRAETPSPADPAGQTVTEKDTRPAPSLGIDESEIGRIDEADPKKPPILAPAGPVEAPPVSDEPKLTVERPTTTAAPPTTLAATTTTAPRPVAPPPFVDLDGGGR